jgi:hypothetical protein
MNFIRFMRDRWLMVYPATVLTAFGLGFLLNDQGTAGSSFMPAALLTLPLSAIPNHVWPKAVNAFFSSFYNLPKVLAAMTMNIAFIGVVQWVCSRLPED